MPLAPGTRLGPYEVLSPLGAGGMGEVYLARDPRLGRDVAIKALPAGLSADPERISRFEREAKLLAALRHPGIAGILGLEEVGGHRYLVLEYVPGETLAARLARGALPVDEAIAVCRQIAAAVEAAHESGIVHRDLKPGNVMLSPEGDVKVLDFGLAKGGVAASAGSDPNLSASPTMTYAATGLGVVLGTAAYMSPEQARGKPVDRRTDVWSFGCVLYECLTGRQAFEGETVSDLVARILEREPDWSQLPAATPARVRELLRRCLRKDARERLRDIGDARLEMEEAAKGGAPESVPTVAPHRPSPWLHVAGAVIGALAGVLVTKLIPHAAAPQPLVRFMLAAPPGAALGQPAEADLSPDGRTLAFVASDSGGTDHLYVRALASPEAHLVPGTERVHLPFWSPDGKALAFFSAGKLRKVGLDGSAPVVLCDAPDARGGAWSPAGVILFAPNSQGPIVRVPENGGAPVPVTRLEPARHELGHRYPQFLPDGRHFLYVAIGSGEEQSTFASSVDGGTPVEVCRAGSGARYAGPGYLLYLDTGVNSPQRRLLARRFDTRRLRATGDAALVLDDVNANNFGYANVAAGARGTLLVEHWSDAHARLEWWDRQRAVTGVAVQDQALGAVSLSPDGRRLAYAGQNPRDLQVLDLEGGVTTRLTFENQQCTNLVWSPDGRRIAFARLFGARGWEIHVKNADGTGADSLVFHGPGLFSYPLDWSRDGRWLVAQVSDAGGNLDLWRIPMAGGGRPTVYQATPAQEQGASISPDGGWIAYVASEQGKPSLYVQSFPEPGAKYQLAVEDPVAAGWTPAGNELLVFTSASEVLSVQVSTAGGFRQGTTTRLFKVPPGQFIVDYSRATGRFLAAAPKDLSALTRLEVVLGWPHLLSQH